MKFFLMHQNTFKIEKSVQGNTKNPYPLIFIVGVGRSGTTLLQAMLASHTKVAFPPEISFVRRYVAKRKLAKIYRKTGIESVRTVLLDDPKIKRLDLDLNEVFSPFESNTIIFSDASLYKVLLESVAKRANKTIIGDKDPRCVEYVQVIHQYWPEAYIIHIIRDPRDVLASKKKSEWSRNRASLLHIFANYIQMDIGVALGPKLFGSHYQQIIYEELITDPRSILQQVCKRLHLDFDEAMLDFSKKANEIIASEEYAWKKEVMGPLLVHNSGKWRETLTDWEVALTELICHKTFMIGGYEQSNCFKNLPYYKRLSVKCGYYVLLAMGIIYRSYRQLSMS
jgi:hypothetical protein